MDESEVADAINSNVLLRRRSSVIDHVNRIRIANLKRQIKPLWKNIEIERLSKNPKQNVAKDNFTSYRRKTLNDITEFSEDFFQSDVKNLKDAFEISSKNRLSLDSMKDNRMHGSAMLGELQSKTRKEPDFNKRNSKKDIEKETINLNPEKDTEKIHEDSEKTQKNSKLTVSESKKESLTLPKQSVSKTRKRSENLTSAPISKPRKKSGSLTKPLVSSKKKSKNLRNSSNSRTKKGSRILKRKSSNQKYTNVKRLSEQNINFHNKNYVKGWTDQITGQEKSGVKDIVILNWLHELNCPKAMSRNSLGMENSKKYPIRILKKPVSEDFSKRKNTLRKASQVSFKTIKTVDKKKVPSTLLPQLEISNDYQGNEEMISEKSSTDLEKHTKNDEKIEDSSITNLTRKSNDFFLGDATQRSEEIGKNFDVEMHLSERGKLQICLNVNRFSPDDTAIVIWLDDLLSKMKSKVNTSRDINLIRGIQSAPTLERFAEGIRSESVIKLEDSVSPRPNIYFPSVTVLKNLVVDSKVGLKDLNEDNLNSVYYKRCNLNHVDSELN